MTKQTNHKPGATTVASAIAPDAYTRITNRIVADLEQGVRPWCKPWGGDQLGARITRPRRAGASAGAMRDTPARNWWPNWEPLSWLPTLACPWSRARITRATSQTGLKS